MKQPLYNSAQVFAFQRLKQAHGKIHGNKDGARKIGTLYAMYLL